MKERNHSPRLLDLLVVIALVFGICASPAVAKKKGGGGGKSGPPTFYQGTLSGGDIQNWTLWMATAGSSARALTFGQGGPAPGDSLIGAKGDGTVKKTAATLKLFGLGTNNAQVRVGNLNGTIGAAGLTGNFSLAGRTGNFTTTRVNPDQASITALTGTFRQSGSDGSWQVVLRADGTFEISGQALGRTFAVAQGNWTATAEDLWLLPSRLSETNDFFDLAIKLLVPIKLGYQRVGNELNLFDPVNNGRLVTLQKQ